MSIRFISLSSSSRFGNAYLVEGPGKVRILVDCGIRLRRMEALLCSLGIDPASIQAIFLTHEHGDHTAALKPKTPFPQKYGIPVYANRGLWQRLRREIGCLDPQLMRVMTDACPIEVGNLSVSAFAKPHDAVAPLGYIIRGGEEQLGVVTDLGNVTTQIVERLKGSEYLIFESNHDYEMERASDRPWSLIRRVLGDEGHLSNHQAAEALARVVNRQTRGIALAHLSLDCNTPELAEETVGKELKKTPYKGFLATLPADKASRWFPELSKNGH